jgi:hypothetical protein
LWDIGSKIAPPVTFCPVSAYTPLFSSDATNPLTFIRLSTSWRKLQAEEERIDIRADFSP